MDPIIRAAHVSSVPRQLRGATLRVDKVKSTPIATQIAQHVLSPAASPMPVSTPIATAIVSPAPPSDEERRAHAAALEDLAVQKARLLAAGKKLDDERAALLADAERRGLALGQEKGERQALSSVARKVDLLATLAGAIEASRREVLEQAQDMLVEVAYTAVCRIIGATAATRETLLEMVRGIARDEHAAQQWRVRLHPQDFATLHDDAAAIDVRITLQADSAVVLGGCIVDSDQGTLDARLETQLTRLGDALTAVRRGAPVP